MFYIKVFLFMCLLCICVYAETADTDQSICMNVIPKTRFYNQRVYNRQRCKGRPSCILRMTQKYTTREPGCCTHYEYIAATKTCEPICELGCFNGTCIKPGICYCEPPLRLEKNKCVPPVCEPHCGPNSSCVDNNNCSCHDGFIPINSTHCAPRCLPGYFNDPIDCKPKCDNVCVNGTCTAPNTCLCNAGYSKINDYTCSPKCDTPCKNADCIEPNVCSCLSGYTQEDQWTCKPVCINCTHGECTAPGHCECHSGYANIDEVCLPHCQKPCSNGMCVEPDKCQCNLGYELDPNDKFNCLPICEPKCVNASCVSPYKCSCLSGYETAGNNWTCKPTCDECDNGDCIGPDNCKCHQGYERVNGKCQPKCSKPCSNGVCTAPEVCTCAENYSPSADDRYKCNPICEPACVNSSCVAPGVCECLPKYESTRLKHACKPQCKTCIHGDCVAPDVCLCHQGYNGTEGFCSPVCTEPCVNSDCTSPDTCTCIEEYQKNSTSPNVCYKKCEGECEHGTCDLHGNCDCEVGYELMNGTCVEIEPVNCDTCPSNCTVNGCWCDNGTPCFLPPTQPPAEVASSTSLAGLELTWMLGAALGFLLIVFLLVVILRIGKKRRQYGNKPPPEDVPFGSVVYTVPDTLIPRRIPEEDEEPRDRFYEEVTLDGRQNEEGTTDRLLEGAVDESL